MEEGMSRRGRMVKGRAGWGGGGVIRSYGLSNKRQERNEITNMRERSSSNI